MKIPKTKKINSCRLCNSKSLTSIYSFGSLYISNFVKKNLIKKSKKAPLNLLHCSNCDLYQLQHTAPQELLYKGFYWYKSGVTQTMKEGLHNIYLESKKFSKLKKNDVVLDIGANDGTMLKYFKNAGYKTIGCEPAKNLKNELKKNCNFLLSDFWNFKNFSKLKKKYSFKKPKLITAIGMFYDLDNPSIFIKDIYKSLSDDGVFVAQLMCLKSMLEKNDLGNICHEHLEFYSYKSLIYLFETNGFKIVKLEENNINAGSYRIFCTKKLKKEKSIKVKENTTIKRVKKFINDVNLSRDKTYNFIKNEVGKGKKIIVYGASTKGNTILQYFNLDNKLIEFAAERSPSKYGKYTVGTGIKIIPEKIARKMNPDYFLVLPWAFLREFKKREKDWLNKGGKFIVPFPKFRLISSKK
jgi:NDP-4-keto-2,6-dideoxyhexose 3-C-methyltransferase